MSDRELLELAAKAAGIDGEYVASISFSGFAGDAWRPSGIVYIESAVKYVWNPLDNDGDAARLEAALGMDVIWWSTAVSVDCHSEGYEDHDSAQAARRYAAVRAAAEIGKAMTKE